MSGERVRLAQGIPDLRALGAEEARELLEPGGEPLGFDRADVVSEDPRATLIRYPLPGTPDKSGAFHEPPRGAGTGFVHLRRYRGGGLVELCEARFTQPPSESLAEREWNLICHLKGHGVGAPDLLAVGARSGPAFTRSSFLVTRELGGMVALSDWWRAPLEASARRRGVLALGRALFGLFRCGGWLPRLSASQVWLSAAEAGVEGLRTPTDCAADEITELRAARSAGARRNRLPSVVFTGFERGRVLPRVGAERRVALLARLDAETGARAELARERLRVARLALEGVPRGERRRVLRSLAARRG